MFFVDLYKPEKISAKDNINQPQSEYIRKIPNEVKHQIMEAQYDIIFHLAAQSLVSEAALKTLYTLETNIIGTYNILEIFNEHETAKLLSISTTDKVYKKPESNNVEDSELASHEFYSASKVSKENIINAFINTKIKDNNVINLIKYSRGLNNLLTGYEFNQKELNNFIICIYFIIIFI